MNSLSILYAEDEVETRKNYANYLQRHFKDTYIVDNGEDALKYYEEFKPNILLLDINMPMINGLEVAKKIRQKDKKTRIIILTAHLQRDKLLFAAELNLTKYLPKPISRSDLKLALNEAVEQFKELNGTLELVKLDENTFWDKKTKKLIFENQDVKLTKYEILLLELLSSKQDRVFSLDEISLHLWNDIDDLESSSTKLKDIIKRLRKKIPKNSIENIYGAGYKLNF